MEKVISRPGLLLWSVTLIAVTVTVAMLLIVPADGKCPLEAVLLFASLFGGGSVTGLSYCLRNVIYASPEGLRWRDRKGWHTAAWEEISDFYMVVSPKS